MVNLYGVDTDVTNMLDSFDWYILPVFNVDGYEYTWTTVSIQPCFVLPIPSEGEGWGYFNRLLSVPFVHI